MGPLSLETIIEKGANLDEVKKIRFNWHEGSGNCFFGQLMNKKPFGIGRKCWNSGLIQEGFWIKGLLNGYGRQITTKGMFREGVWHNGRLREEVLAEEDYSESEEEEEVDPEESEPL